MPSLDAKSVAVGVIIGFFVAPIVVAKVRSKVGKDS